MAGFRPKTVGRKSWNVLKNKYIVHILGEPSKKLTFLADMSDRPPPSA